MKASTVLPQVCQLQRASTLPPNDQNTMVRLFYVRIIFSVLVFVISVGVFESKKCTAPIKNLKY